MKKSLPNLMGEDHTSKDIHYSQDTNHIYALDPTHVQTANLYFMESTISLKSNIWDVFELFEKELTMYDHSYTQQIPYYVPSKSTPLEEQTYVKMFLR